MNVEPHDAVDDGANVLVLSNDLFFAMRIRDALRQLGHGSDIVKSEAEFRSGMNDSARATLGIIDFNHAIDWELLAPTISGNDMPIIAFGPHKDTAGFAAAKRAGVTRVISNGAFTSSLPDLVQRYIGSKSD